MWVFVLLFLMTSGRTEVVYPQMQAFDTKADCEAHKSMVNQYIQLRPNEKSWQVVCERKRDTIED